MRYIEKIKSTISISASKKTTNLLDGLYRSIFKGRSMDFDDLRDYVQGDNNKDIDWKSSIRHGSLLVRRFIAFKRHNILFVLDTGKKFAGLTNSGEEKKDIMLYTFGTLAYLVNKNEDEISTIYHKNNKLCLRPFKTGLSNIEVTLNEVDDLITNDSNFFLNDILEYALNNSKRKMIFVVISDLLGMENISENILKKITMAHDLLFINIGDASIYGDNLFDLDSDKNIPKFIANNKKIKDIETKIKDEIFTKNEQKLKKYRVSTVTINSKNEIVKMLIDLLERHNHAVNH